MGSSPLSAVDPRGESTLGAAIGGAIGRVAGFEFGGPLGSTVGGLIGGGIGDWATGNEDSEVRFPGALAVPEKKDTQQAERKAYSKICKTKPPSTGDKCLDAKNNLDRLKRCLALREDFGKKWFNDQDMGHEIENQNTRTAIDKLTKWIKDNCEQQCK